MLKVSNATPANGAAQTKSSQLLITKHSPSFWRVTLDNPPINLMGPEMISGLQQLMDVVERDPELKVIVFDSANDRFGYSAGAGDDRAGAADRGVDEHVAALIQRVGGERRLVALHHERQRNGRRGWADDGERVVCRLHAELGRGDDNNAVDERESGDNRDPGHVYGDGDDERESGVVGNRDVRR